ncbi:MAG TPA: hypothetical protein ENJ46_00315 [Hellea balneolensis]|uniref:Uncharacterized protein n=1 Tax=Hellea balneolensis TaxID=287478 RepID=A0A7C3GK44_9PROT|nr:hypothetical protein [Hellea balneolensis]
MPIPPICTNEAYFCQMGADALVMGRSERLPDYLMVIEEARARYSQYFKSPSLKTAVFTSDRMSKEVTDSLEAAGYGVLLPWTPENPEQEPTGLSDAEIRAQITAQVPGASEAMIDSLVARAKAQQAQQNLAPDPASTSRGGGLSDAEIRAQITAQVPGATTEMIDGLVAQAKAQQAQQNPVPESDNLAPEMEAGAIAHELAHLWFIKGRWEPGNAHAVDPATPKYGSNAPDWLDEIVAVLTETSAMTQGRQRGLKSIVAKDGMDALWPLEDYFVMEHPVFKRAQTFMKMREGLGEPTQKGGRNTYRISGEAARKLLATDSAQKPANFYAQSRGFADFMIQTSGEPYIFDNITEELKSGGSMQTWLARDGKKHGLPSSVAGLEKIWMTWLLAQT